MSLADPWLPIPRHRAAAWAQLDYFDSLLAMDLLTVIGSKERAPVPLAVFEANLFKRLGIGAKNRKRARLGLARMKAAGLLFEHEGETYLLYSETMYRKHRALGESKRPQMETPANDNAAAAAQSVSRQSAVSEPSVSRQNEVTARIHSLRLSIERERETERENTTCSTAAPPAAAPPPPTADPVTETRPTLAKAARRRAPQPLDAPRERAVALFNELWSPTRGQGATWAPRGTDFGLLTAMVRCYLHPDGTLNESLYRLSVRAFLREESWRNYGGWKPQKFMVHHLGGLTQAQPTGTESAYAGF